MGTDPAPTSGRTDTTDDGDEAKRVDAGDVSPELFEAVVNTTGFQKILQYRQLAVGIEAVKENDALKQELVDKITSRHSNVSARRSTEEFFELLVDEIEEYTEGIADGLPDGDEDELQALLVEE